MRGRTAAVTWSGRRRAVPSGRETFRLCLPSSLEQASSQGIRKARSWAVRSQLLFWWPDLLRVPHTDYQLIPCPLFTSYLLAIETLLVMPWMMPHSISWGSKISPGIPNSRDTLVPPEPFCTTLVCLSIYRLEKRHNSLCYIFYSVDF